MPALATKHSPPRQPLSASYGVLLNDLHSSLNPTKVAHVVAVRSEAEVVAAIRRAGREGQAISVAGGRHAMGGQAFGTDTLHLDTRGLDRILAFDPARGLLEAEAGIQWPALMAWTRAHAPAWGIAQKQTGADHLSLGGALSANVHGRGLAMAPFVSDVEAFTLVDAEGRILRCSRNERPDLFALAIGGYGLFGVITSVQLRLAPRVKVARRVTIREAGGLIEAFDARRRSGCFYGDFQFEIDPCSPGFLRRGVFACYAPVPADTVLPEHPLEIPDEGWRDLLFLAHAHKAEAFERYAAHYLATDGQIYWSDDHQLSFYPEGYHGDLDARLGARCKGTEMISELYVPRPELEGFLADAAELLRSAQVIYGTVRLIERDDETFLAWAREAFACMVLNLHVDHTEAGIASAQASFQGLIDLALARGGSYYLTYHRWARRDQVLAAHPRILEFLRLKEAYDPGARFQSEWWRHHVALPR